MKKRRLLPGAKLDEVPEEVQALILAEGGDTSDQDDAVVAYMALDEEAGAISAKLLRENQSFDRRLRIVLLLRNVAARIEEVYRNRQGGKAREPEGAEGDPMKDFPKIQSPFVRKTIDGAYVATPEIDPEYTWVFEDGTLAVDKLHGTNVGIRLEARMVTRVFNRTTEKFPLSVRATAWEGACLEGLAWAIKKGWLRSLPDGDHYGELIGPIINGNHHQVDHHVWVPFEHLKRKCAWRSWSQNKYPKTFESISEWFREIPSMFCSRMGKQVLAEGLVFYHPDGRMAKLRRDMFPWYKGPRHKEGGEQDGQAEGKEEARDEEARGQEAIPLLGEEDEAGSPNG